MADVLTTEERAAIARFPKDRITRVPRGRSAFEITYDQSQVHNDLKALGLSAHRDPEQVVPNKGHRDPAVEARRDEAARMARSGHRVVDIARALGLSPKTVRDDLRSRGIGPMKAGPRTGVVSTATRRHYAPHRTVREIFHLVRSDGIETTEQAVRSYLHRLGLKAAPMDARGSGAPRKPSAKSKHVGPRDG